ncbi:MAG: hypothetical protein ACPF8V_04040 [Luteibaculum sp.]
MNIHSNNASNILSFPVVIHQTNNAYYLKIGNEKSHPEDFNIIIEDGKLVIEARGRVSKKLRNKIYSSFLHTAKGQMVVPPKKQSSKSPLKSAVGLIKSLLF